MTTKKSSSRGRAEAKSPAAKPVAPSGDKPKTVVTATAATTGGRPPAPPAAVAIAAAPGDPSPDWTLQQHEAFLAAALPQFEQDENEKDAALAVLKRRKEKTGYLTGHYWACGRSFQIVNALHLYPAGVTFRQWYLQQGWNDTYRSRAEGIADLYPSRAEAEKDSVPTAIRKVTAMRSGEKPVSESMRFRRKVAAIEAAIKELQAIGAKMTEDEIVELGDEFLGKLFDAFHALEALTQRVEEPQAEPAGAAR